MRDDWKKRQDNPEEFNAALYQRTDELYQVNDAIPDENGQICCPV